MSTQDKKITEIGTSGKPHKPPRKGIYILPNLFTTAGLFAGFYAIIQATKGNFEAAAIAIFVAMVMDGLDGRVARLTNTFSDFGAEYDSLADVIAFGLAPALVVYELSLHQLGKVGWLVAFFYVAMAALRLARFNTQKTQDKRYFHGLPSPASAVLLAAWVWVIYDYQLSALWLSWAGAAIVTVAGAAMVSNLNYRSFKDLDMRNKVPFVALLALVLVFVLIAFDPPRVLLILSLSYFLSGPLLLAWTTLTPKRSN